jgi:lipopolysaccharide/colanic/teichoic acid biosynthesis glycosyltransferase
MQVNRRGELDMDQRLKLEMDYIDHYLVWWDLSILG